MIEAVYALIRLLPRFDHQTSRRQLPRNGVFLFFEKGETVRYFDMITDRIVRIGTHRSTTPLTISPFARISSLLERIWLVLFLNVAS